MTEGRRQIPRRYAFPSSVAGISKRAAVPADAGFRKKSRPMVFCAVIGKVVAAGRLSVFVENWPSFFKWKFHGPVVRQVNGSPCAVVEIRASKPVEKSAGTLRRWPLDFARRKPKNPLRDHPHDRTGNANQKSNRNCGRRGRRYMSANPSYVFAGHVGSVAASRSAALDNGSAAFRGCRSSRGCGQAGFSKICGASNVTCFALR